MNEEIVRALVDAEGGDADAMLMLAIGYEAGFFVTRDEARAAEWYQGGGTGA